MIPLLEYEVLVRLDEALLYCREDTLPDYSLIVGLRDASGIRFRGLSISPQPGTSCFPQPDMTVTELGMWYL
jgi:hypothetical protein